MGLKNNIDPTRELLLGKQFPSETKTKEKEGDKFPIMRNCNNPCHLPIFEMSDKSFGTSIC